jgi:hypothetical protein
MTSIAQESAAYCSEDATGEAAPNWTELARELDELYTVRRYTYPSKHADAIYRAKLC